MKPSQPKPVQKRKLLNLSEPDNENSASNENEKTEAGKAAKKEKRGNKEIIKNFKCPDCTKSYVFRSSLIFHRKSHMQYNDMFICFHCNKLFKQKMSLQFHIMTHNDEKPFECFLCPKKFLTYAKLILHVKLHMSEKTYQCGYCDIKYMDKVILATHIETTHSSEVGYKGTQLYYSEYHASDVIKQIKEYLFNKGKMFKCHKCDNQFQFRNELSKHLLMHGRDDLYKCPCCDNRYAWNSSLSRHVRTHLKTLTKCNYCNKVIKRNEHIKVHTRSHTGVKPYACNSCDDRFSWRTSIRRHLTKKLIQGNAIFCSVCKEYFNSKCHKHFKKRRPRQKMFSCKYCNQNYSLRVQLNRHISRKHEIRNNYENYGNKFDCKYCGEIFKLRFARNAHVKNHEKFLNKGYLTGLHYICAKCGEIHTGEKFNITGDINDIHNEHSYASLFEIIPNIANRCNNYNLRPTIKYKNLEFDDTTPTRIEESQVVSDNWDTFQNVILFENINQNEIEIEQTIDQEKETEKEKSAVLTTPQKKRRKRKNLLTLARKNMRKKQMLMKNGGILDNKHIRKSVRKRNITFETYRNIIKQQEFNYTCRYCNSHYDKLEELKTHIIENCSVDNFIKWAINKLN